MPLIIHHLHTSQSERIPWLCEELHIPYQLKTYKRHPMFAPPEYKALHPSGSAPIIQDTLPTSNRGDDTENTQTLTLAESGACVQYICQKHGDGNLFLPPSHKDYANFVYWFHWANGTFQPLLARLMTVNGGPGGSAGSTDQGQNPSPNPSPMVALWNDRLQRSLGALDKRFRTKAEGGDGATWLAGDEFTAADIMVVFSLTTFRYWFEYSLREYDGILGYLARVGNRDGYKRAMAKAEPEMRLLLGAEVS
ncbi:hypothetical protein AJ78_04018 [Emergomyces pasteurianus Ep9510]|uniref:Glutathione S-transferase n=1 Tax=Emergomyces pasteurianus Ep9510 TaxID=1447872 RepID=A0A1J9PH57_9EURO|nr:hypothetical protein AJ78_04018 [Emergomyces pasteurianus Ep9510]